jgi:hypothetical protein
MPRGINIVDEAQIQRRLWTPEILGPALWFDASDISTISVSTGVSEWRDKSGYQRHGLQTTVNSRPILTTVNGYPSVQFDGIDDALLISTQFMPTTVANQNYIIIAVVKENNGGFGGVFSTNPGSNNTGTGIVINNTRNYSFFPATAFATTSTGVNRSIVAGVATSIPTQQIFFNGTQEINATVSQTLVHATQCVIGRYRVGDTNFGAIDLNELVIVLNNSSTIMRQQLEGYLAHKWGLQRNLPALHPFVNRPPLIGN